MEQHQSLMYTILIHNKIDESLKYDSQFYLTLGNIWYKWEEQWATEKSNQGRGVNIVCQSADNAKFQINCTKFNIYNYNDTMLEN